MKNDYIKSSIVGFVLADALGVPVEFFSKEEMKANPLIDMIEYGTHHQPIGTWSDDSSMMLATIDSIIQKRKIDYDDIMCKYCDWYLKSKYTATDSVFDIGMTTSNSLNRFLYQGLPAETCGDADFKCNGNGSLMRVLPIALYLNYFSLSEENKKSVIDNFSSMTHSHELSRFGCRLYCDFANELINSGMDKNEALKRIGEKNYSKDYSAEVIGAYSRILDGSIKYASEVDVRGSGFVLHTLEASIWALLQTDSYEKAVLAAINLGEDTDTVGAITGSLAGMVYGYDNIPKKWLVNLKKRDYIENLADNFSNVLLINDLSRETEEPKIRM